MISRIREFLGTRSGRRLLAAAAVVLAASFAYAGYRLWHQPPRHKGGARLEVDLGHPDFVIVTRNLAQLPKAIAETPALSGLVDEQLVFHYEEDEARLSMEGVVRRLAYEHRLDLGDRFVAALLAAPAEIGVWRGAKGRPEYYVASIERGALGKLTQALAKIVADDRQLKLAGKISVSGDDVPVYTLAYGGGRSLAFAGVGNRWIVLSDPRLGMNEKGEFTGDAANVLINLLQGHHPWRDVLPHAAKAEHSVVVGGQALTLDYARFLPALKAFRFDHDGKQWHSAIQLDRPKDARAPDVATIWRAVPGQPALCAAVPVDWAAAEKPLRTLVGEQPALPAVLAALDPTAAVCWYPNSRLAAPLFVARAARPLPEQTSEMLAVLAQKAWAKDGQASSASDKNGAQRFVSAVPSRHGSQRGDDGARLFRATLARHQNLFFFSPDERHVSAALNVAAKRAPALGDESGMRQGGWLVYDPNRLGQLLRNDLQEVLPPDDESFFRGVARAKLWPRLEAWGKQHAASVLVPGSAAADGFVGLEPRPLKAAAK